MTNGGPQRDEPWPWGVPVPPRGEDLPWDDGEPLESGFHRKQLELLCETLDEVLAGREDVYVSGNMAVYYSALQAKKNDFKAPDVFVVLDAQGRHERKSWVLWEEDLRTPNLVVELLSPTTEDNDRGPKKLIYERLLRVPNYFLYDPLDFRFEGFRLVDGEYVPMTPDADGRLPWREGGVVLGRWTGSYRGQVQTAARGRAAP